MTLEVYGRIVTAPEVEDAVIAHLQLWLQTYIAEVERQQGLDPESLPMMRSFLTSKEFTKWPEDQLPACVVIAPGLTEKPKREGEAYRARWAAGIGIAASGRDKASSRRLAQWYTAAARASILQHQTLGDFGSHGVEWMEEEYNMMRTDSDRSLAAGQAIFTVEVRDVTNVMLGPLVPPDDPYTEQQWPSVETADTDVEAMT